MRILTLILITLLYLPLQGQIIDQMAQSTCDCMSAQGVEDKDAKAIKALMQECLVESLLPRLADLQKELGVEMTDTEGMRGVGEKIGTRMVTLCPTLMLAMVEEEKAEETLGETIEEVEMPQVTGKIIKIEGEEFVKVTIEDESGSTYKLLWILTFEGDERLIAMGKKAIGKNVTVEYNEILCYSAKAKKYVAQKGITSMSFR